MQVIQPLEWTVLISVRKHQTSVLSLLAPHHGSCRGGTFRDQNVYVLHGLWYREEHVVHADKRHPSNLFSH